MEHKVLGKGLSALIPEKTDSLRTEAVTYIKISSIKDNSLQPRINYNEEKLSELIQSIKEKGVIQPILVREKDGSYEIIAGERRLKAAKALNMEEVPVIIKKVNDQEALVLALVENIQREELNAIEEAKAFKRLVDDFQFTQEEVAKSVGKDRTTIANILRLLKLPEEIQKSVFEGFLTFGHARALLSLENPHEQKRIFEYTLKKDLSVREIENLVRKGFKLRSAKRVRSGQKNREVVILEEELQRFLGTKVRIQTKKKRGEIIIEYYSPDDLDRIIQLIQK